MKKTISLLLSLMMLCSVALCGNTCVFADDTFTVNIVGSYGQTEARTILEMVNSFRQSSEAWYWNEDNTTKTVCNGLSKLNYDYGLEKTAMLRAAELVLSFSHTRPNGNSCFSAYPSNIGYKGENIAIGYGDAASVFDGWREDDCDYSGQGHRRNMLNSHYTTVGFGHYYANGIHCWVQEFGSSKTDVSATAPNDSYTVMPIEMMSSMLTGIKLIIPCVEIKVKEGESVKLPQGTLYITTSNSWGVDQIETADPLVWSSQDTSVAEVSGNSVKGKAYGTTALVVKATVDGNSISRPYNVTVSHNMHSTITKATMTKDGVIVDCCSSCGYEEKTTIAHPKSIKLNTVQCRYSGFAQEPSVIIQDSNGDYISFYHYSVSYSNNTQAGLATAVITFNSEYYSGSKTLRFEIYKPGWVRYGGKSYYFYDDGSKAKGLIRINNKLKYFDSHGVYQGYTGWQTINGKSYYFDSKHNAVTGINLVDRKLKYFNNDGVYQKCTGWQTIGGKKYYFNKNHNALKGFKKIGGKLKYFDQNGVYQQYTGWQTIGRKSYYFTKNHNASIGFRKIKGQLKYFDQNGVYQGYTGWKKIDGKYYYFNSRHTAVTGFCSVNKQLKYFDSDGVYQGYTGWQKNNDKYYYFTAKYSAVTGWQKFNQKYYYFNQKGVMQTGWQKINSKYYHFKKNGVMQTGWYQENGKWYYFTNKGVMVADTELTINGKTYRFDNKGVCLDL